MKKILSIVLTIALAVSCLAIFTNAASEPVVVYQSDTITTGAISTYYKVEALWNDDATQVTLTVNTYPTVVNSVSNSLSYCAYLNFYATDLKYVDGSMVTFGQKDSASVQPYEFIDCGDGLVGVSGGVSEGLYEEGVAGHCYVSWTLDVLAAPGSEIVVWEDGFETSTGEDVCYNGSEWYNGGDPLFTLTVPTAEEDTHTAPATPVADTKDACEACGTEAGVRFLMTVDKTADDYADVTAYGVVIETADGEYKYTVDANTKKAETDTKIEYAVVVTGAPAGTTFTATAFLVYSDDCEVAGVSGELTA